jgi:hypothetical protein
MHLYEKERQEKVTLKIAYQAVKRAELSKRSVLHCGKIMIPCPFILIFPLQYVARDKINLILPHECSQKMVDSVDFEPHKLL